MTILLIDADADVTAELPAFVSRGVRGIGGYMSSINPIGAKCLTPKRVRAIGAHRLFVVLLHEGWGGVGGKGISAADGARDGKYCRFRAPQLFAPRGTCVYFACDRDFTDDEINNLVIPYFQAIRQAFADGFYRVGVYGSGAVCRAITSLGLADLSFEAQSRGWTGYSQFKAHASIVQGGEGKLAGIDVDFDAAQGDIGSYLPSADALPLPVSPPLVTPPPSGAPLAPPALPWRTIMPITPDTTPDPKPWYASQTVWGGIAAIGGGFGGVAYAIQQKDPAAILPALVAAAGGIHAVIGRFKADTPIGRALTTVDQLVEAGVTLAAVEAPK
jgi:hypothetical protein